MIKRIINLPSNKSFFLFGPRQTGKSTLINSRYKQNIWRIDLLHSDKSLKYSKAPSILRKEAAHKITKEKIKTIFIDEIQKVPALLDEVHSLIETFKGCQFILTGSSPRKLKRGAANLLAGRLIQRHLFPFTLDEISDNFDLDDVLRFGSLPAIYGKTEQEKFDILKAYTEIYLKEEIQAEGIARNLGGFSRLLDIVAAQCGELVSFSATGREVQLPVRTVQAYYEILEDTLIGLRLDAWGKSLRKRLTTHPKFYLFDLGVTNSITLRLSSFPDSLLKGRLFEQYIILETYRILKYKQSEARLFYWRTNNGAEVDLLIEHSGKIISALEIKSAKIISGADLSGLRSFREEHPKCPLYVISCAENAYEIDGITVLPWKEYLLQLKKIL